MLIFVEVLNRWKYRFFYSISDWHTTNKTFALELDFIY